MNQLLLATCAVALAMPTSAQRGGRGGEDPWTALAKYDQNKNGEITAEEYPRGERGFKNLDKNRDGVITKADFERRSRGGRRDMSSMLAGMLAARADGDDDGNVTKAEFVSYVEKLDGDGDGSLGSDELSDALSAGGRRMQPGTIARMTRGLGADGGGGLQVSEITALFAVLDADKDDVLSKQEMPAQRQSRGRGGRSRNNRGARREPPAEDVPKIGETAPDFDLPYVNDLEKTVALSSFKGKKPVALIFGSYT